jgi:hypothetical protein
MYVGLWSRLAGFERAALTGALERREVVQGTLMRVTIHLVSRADYWPLALATRAARRALWLRVYPEPSARSMAAAARRLRAALDGGTMTRKEVEALLGRERARGIHVWLDIARVPPSGTWERRRADLYAAAADWIGEPEDPLAETDAIAHLVRRYLAGYGPASRKDVASFTGIGLTALKPALARLELRTLRSEAGEELIDLPDAPLPDPETPAPPRFLPTWDATLLVHARRTQILPEEHRAKIFNTKVPHSFPTFLVDGRVAGTWRYGDGEVQLAPFGPLPLADERALHEEAGRLAAFHA